MDAEEENAGMGRTWRWSDVVMAREREYMVQTTNTDIIYEPPWETHERVSE